MKESHSNHYDETRTTSSSISARTSPKEELSALKKWMDNEEQVVIHAEVCMIRSMENFDHYRVVVSCEDQIVLQEDFHNFPTKAIETSLYPIVSTVVPKSIGMFSIFDELKVQLLNISEDEGIIEQVAIPVICIDRKDPSILKLAEFGVELIVTFQIIAIAPTPERIDQILEGNIEKKAVPAVSGLTPEIRHERTKVQKTALKLQFRDLLRLFEALYKSLLLGGHTLRHMISLCSKIMLLVNDSSKLMLVTLTDFNLELLNSAKTMIVLLSYRLSSVPIELQSALQEVLDNFVTLLQRQYHLQVKPTVRSKVKIVKPYIFPVWNQLSPVVNLASTSLTSLSMRLIPKENSTVASLLRYSSAVVEEVQDLFSDDRESEEVQQIEK